MSYRDMSYRDIEEIERDQAIADLAAALRDMADLGRVQNDRIAALEAKVRSLIDSHGL